MDFSLFKNYNCSVLYNEVMSNHTTYKIGGPVKFFITVNDIDGLQYVIKNLKKYDIIWDVIGSGSNLLVSDDGFSGAIIQLDGIFKKIEFDAGNNQCFCGAGVKMSKLVSEYIKKSFKGLEFFAGIPGTLGGAAKMNAGTKDTWLSCVIKSINVMDKDGNIFNNQIDSSMWNYRQSPIEDNHIVLDATLSACKIQDEDERLNIKKIINIYKTTKKNLQPLNYPSCGSVFKNPKNDSAGRLIEQAGFKGYSIGGACVSEKHANFIINKGNAKACDVLSIIQNIQKKIHKNTGIVLKPEVKFLGFNKRFSLF